MAQKPLTYKQKSGIAFIEQDDPPFIKEMKKKMGFKEPPKLEDKFEDEGPSEFDDAQTELLRMKEEDRPEVVVFDPETDLSQEEVNKELKRKQKEEDDKKIAEGKITFKKPVKRSTVDGAEEDAREEKKKKKTEVKQPEGRLLSFNCDDEEDE
ncbi:hypothetical protein V3C99_004640 [Haemonchus contortus]|uniref:DUF4604 domain-containing protein n=1 Tax=Haemonchus contortus TaxID=6289 RepID=A0A7I5E5Y7_HAECO|nr:Protein T25G3.1 [Haemonchus contortus]